MRKFVLNLLTVFAWIGEIYTILILVLGTVMMGFGIYGRNNSEIRKYMIEGIKEVVDNNSGQSYGYILDLFIILMIVALIGTLIMFFIIRYARLLVKNIKKEIYFASSNLRLLKHLLIAIVLYAIISLGMYIGASPLRSVLISQSIGQYIYPTSAMTSILFLAVFYVVYLVFKYGLELQDDVNNIV